MEPSIVGYIAQAVSFIRRSLENPATKLSNPAQWLVDLFGGGPSAAGVPVSQESAISLTAVWCAVRIISETLASVPLFVYERQKPRGRRKAVDHDLFDRLHLQPNPDMTSYEFRRLMQAIALLHGNAYAFIRRDGAGRPKELWPLPTQTVEPKRTDKGNLIYVVRLNDGTTERFGSMDMLHIRGLGFDGVKGKSVIGAFREGIGLGLAAEKYAAVFFGRGGRVPGVIQTQKSHLQPDEKKNISEDWYSSVGGTDNWHRIAVLTKGMEYKQIGIPPEDSQFMELRKFQVNEVARMFNIQPHKLKDLERATFTNIEQQNIEFVVDTMHPWFVNWEQEMKVKLQPPDERKRFFIEFMVDGLLRGDSAARGAFYALGSQWGWLSTNDIRDWENLPGIGPQGDVYKAPMNMINAKELIDPASGGSGGPQLPPAAAANARRLPAFVIRSLGFRRKLKAVQTPVIEARALLIIRREIEKIEKELKLLLVEDPRNLRNLTSLRKSIDEFYKEHAGWAANRMEPVIRNYAELISRDVAGELGNDPEAPMPPQLEKFVSDYSSRFGAREASEGRLQILALTEQGDEAAVAGVIRERLGEWSEKRPGKIAVAESTQFMAAAAKVVMVVAGVTLLRWVANADSCPFCSTMDGKVVGVEKDFVSAGEGVDAASGDKAPMKLSSNIGHPPLHGGCLCLPGDARVSAQGITATSERWFDGELFILHTASGKKLSCTPNHPVLTDRGWVPAETVDVGDHVVSSGAREWNSSVVGHDQNVPTAIEQITRALREDAEVTAIPVPGSSEHFHGDGRAGEVTIVRANRELLRKVQSTFVQHGGKSLFSLGDAASSSLTGHRPLAPFREGRVSATRRAIRGNSLSAAISVATASPEKPLCSLQSTRRYAERQQTLSDRSSVNAHGSGEPQLGFASDVALRQVGEVQRDASSLIPYEATHRASITELNAPLNKTLVDRGMTDAERLGQGELAIAGKVFLDKIVQVERYPFHGRVFNLQTTRGFYVSEGILTHNCDIVAE